MNALCGRRKVSINRGPKRKSETPGGLFCQNKGFLTPAFHLHPIPTLSPMLPLPLPLTVHLCAPYTTSQ